MTFSQRNILLNHFFFLSYLALLLVAAPDLKHTLFFTGLPVATYVIAVYLSYGFIYLLPSLVITKVAHRILNWRQHGHDLSPGAAGVLYAIAIALTAGSLIFLFIDASIFKIFGFHINGFVWNLVTTPGGIESMGSDRVTVLLFVSAILGLILTQMLLLWGVYYISTQRRFGWILQPRKRYRYLLLLFFLFAAGERVIYGVSNLQGYSPVLISSQAFPGYIPFTFGSLARKFGAKSHSGNEVNLKLGKGALNYPISHLEIQPPERPMNIVWLVAESWRWDMLDPEITPATWRFAQRSHLFRKHYSGGNSTRMGMFSMFYGLYGPYWFDFLNARRGPVLMDVLRQQNYQMSMYTSAKFTYPEFDKTIFASIERDLLHENDEGPGWQRDRNNVSDLLNFIRQRDQTRPFMTFMFFESPHARYYFPEDSILREDYLKDFNYVTMDLDQDVQSIKNRYINSCHHLDSQFARILGFLEKEDLLQKTIVIITGDHGEEFMEKGRWGHGSSFVEEQIRVPLILWIPGTGQDQTDQMTSHLDIAPTILARLGVNNPPADYSLGHDLLSGQPRIFTVVSDWSRICYVDSRYKKSIPLKAAGAFKNELSTQNDAAVQNDGPFIKTHQKELIELMHALKRFKRPV
ncbi:sulfatase-like hydrolase/transferase [Desulfatitalea tepidiphila]|uniref:sulfatase-like hydrolase/transferase n=1 Tax=Desulfatitalea tepidiphila TaxID=1185843 RepID=UPI0006B63ABB|nr:sulfatase-like hydrolase/transferase [Desulfatitalea tepidiphila]